MTKNKRPYTFPADLSTLFTAPPKPTDADRAALSRAAADPKYSEAKWARGAYRTAK